MANAKGQKNKQVSAAKDATTIAAASSVTAERAAQTIARTQAEVQKALSELGAKLLERCSEYDGVGAAVELKRQELKQLYDIEAAAQTLDALKEEIEQSRQKFAAEVAERQAAREREESDRAIARNREQKDYEYTLAQHRRTLTDKIQEEVREQERRNKAKQEQLEKSWSEREHQLAIREAEFKDYQNQVKLFPAKLADEVSRVVAQTRQELERNHKHAVELLQKDFQAYKDLSTQTVKSLTDRLEDAGMTIGHLEEALEKARADVKQISEKALDSASSRTVTEALKEVMQTKDQPTKYGK